MLYKFLSIKTYLTHNLIKVIFFALSLSIRLYQIFKFCEIYFSFTTTSVSYEKVSTISLPAITVCISKKYLLREEIQSKGFKTRYNCIEMFSHNGNEKLAKGYPGHYLTNEHLDQPLVNFHLWDNEIGRAHV